MTKVCDFTLVIPAFNEAERIQPTLERVHRFLSNQPWSHEITVVDDGSTDETLALCRRYASLHREVQVIAYSPNRGKGYAVKTGVLSSRGKVVAFSDADMPVPPEAYGPFLDALQKGNDLAIGSRYLPAARWDMSFGRRIAGQGFRLVVRALAGSHVSDTQFGFKMFRAEVAKELFSHLTIEGFAFDAELIRLCQQQGHSIAEVPVQGVNAPGSTVHPIRDSLIMFWQLLLIRFRGYRQPRTGVGGRKYPRSRVVRL